MRHLPHRVFHDRDRRDAHTLRVDAEHRDRVDGIGSPALLIPGCPRSHPAERFVVDVRYNRGGNSEVVRPLLRELQQRPELTKRGRLFVLIGPRTFSSGVLCALGFRSQLDAILVGEPTGGKPNCYGKVRTFTLPNSELLVSYSIKYFKMTDEDTPSVMPDLPVALTFEANATGRDPVLDAVFKYQAE